MQIGSWINLMLVGVVPMLVMSDTGRSWLARGKYSERVWIFLATIAIGGLASVVRVFSGPLRISAAVLVATPLLQAISFVAADKLFQVLAGRVPVSFDESRNGRRDDGRRHWPDVSFWVVVWLGLVVGAIALCVSFGVEFPARGRR